MEKLLQITSQNIGVAPANMTFLAVAANVKFGTITSSLHLYQAPSKMQTRQEFHSPLRLHALHLSIFENKTRTPQLKCLQSRTCCRITSVSSANSALSIHGSSVNIDITQPDNLSTVPPNLNAMV